MIAAILIAWASIAGYFSRIGFVTLFGIGAAITTNVSYWNWYGFPTNYSLAYGLIELAGFVVAGLAIAAIVPRHPAMKFR
jgi:hypothetical protein